MLFSTQNKLSTLHDKYCHRMYRIRLQYTTTKSFTMRMFKHTIEKQNMKAHYQKISLDSYVTHEISSKLCYHIDTYLEEITEMLVIFKICDWIKISVWYCVNTSYCVANSFILE